ncbi:MAG: glycerol-3-phosphate dehydrogenase/oxidase [Candidatus Limnocylindrales bacterium]
MRSLGDRTVDLLVVGGGIIGTGVARDAARRGLTVALVEQDDLASGTSSRPTRLIHGGLRYLELFDFGLVRSDMKEREILLRVAPHLVFPLPFLLPLYRPSLIYRVKLRIGMLLYDLLSLDKSLPKREWLGHAAALAAEPGLNPVGLAGAWRFYDAQVPLVERLVMENAIDAASHGALVLNHAKATGFLREGDRVTGARVADRIGHREIEVRARYTVNATGAWLDETIAPLRTAAKPLLRLTKGIHLVTPRATEQAHVLFAKRDGRLFFVVPWRDCTIVGTTDTDYDGDPAAADATEDDVRYLQAEARAAFPHAPFDVIHFTWAGVRALVRVEGVAEGEVSRKHALYDHQRRDGVSGVLSIIGGKITAYRAIAEEVADRVARTLDASARGDTARAPLPGAGEPVTARAASLGLPAAVTANLVEVYGSLAARVLELVAADPSLATTLCAHEPTIAGELAYVVDQEWAMTLGDALLRRTGVGLRACQALDCIDSIAQRMGALCGWDAARRVAELDAYRRELAPMRAFSAG